MAVPRVFISSTYYDLKHVRNDIGQFIIGLGYEPVMHDKGSVAYTQSDTLEQSCYKELSTCDIVVCIIGNKFGTQSENGNYSITMEELQTAIKQQKKIYICLQKDVAIENMTYIANKGIEGFKPVFADNIVIHEFIYDIKLNIKKHPIIEFDTIQDIISNLRSQFAGVFQYLLRSEATLTEEKTYADLVETSDNIKQLVEDFRNEKDVFFNKFDTTIMINNLFITTLAKKLNITKSYLYIKSFDALTEFLLANLFVKSEDVDEYCWIRKQGNKTQKLTIDKKVFDNKNVIKIIRSLSESEDLIKFEEEIEASDPFSDIEDDGDLPF